MKTSFGRISALFLLIAILASLLSSPVFAQEPLWKIDGFVLDTSGQFSAEAANEFTVASLKSGYPIYLLILDESLYQGNDLETPQIALKIFNGEYGAQYQWHQKGKEQGFFPDDVIIIVAAPFLVRPQGDLPDNHPWLRAVVDVRPTNQFQALLDSAVVTYKDEQMYASKALAQQIDEELVVTGKLNTVDSALAVRFITDMLKKIGVNETGSVAPVQAAAPTAISAQPQAQPTYPSSSEESGSGVGFWRGLMRSLMWLVGVLLLVGILWFIYEYVVGWWIARQKAVSAAEIAAHMCSTWNQQVQETQTAIADASNFASPQGIQQWNATVVEATKLADQPAERYPQVMRSVGDPKRWLATPGYEFITREIEAKLLVDLRRADALLDTIYEEISELKQEAGQANVVVGRAGSEVNAALTAIEASKADGYPSVSIEAAANEAFGLYQQAQTLVTSRQYEEAFTLAQQAVDGARKAATDIASWQDRIGGLPQEIEAVSQQIVAIRTGLPILEQIIAALKAAYAFKCFDEIVEHPGAIVRLLDQLDPKVVEAKEEMAAKKFDAVVVILTDVSAGVEKAQSLQKSVKERDEDLREMAEQLSGQIADTMQQFTDAIAYVESNDALVDTETEEELRTAGTNLKSAQDELKLEKPDVEVVAQWHREAEEVIEALLQDAKTQVEKLQAARKKAENLLGTSSKVQSRVLNFIEDHDDDGIDASTKRQATQAQGSHQKAAAMWEAAEALGNGQEAQRLELYTKIAQAAKAAQDAAEEAFSEAQRDVEQPAPTWTPSYSSGSSYSGGYTTRTTLMPVYRPSYRPSTPSVSSSPSRSSMGGGSSSRSYSAPSISRSSSPSPARSSMGGGSSSRR